MMMGSMTVRVRGSDCSGANIYDDFILTVNNVNDPPEGGGDGDGNGSDPETSAIPPHRSVINLLKFRSSIALFSLRVLSRMMTLKDVLSYTAHGHEDGTWPSWLLFDGGTQTFSSSEVVPLSALHQSYILEVIATDNEGANASATFTLTVVMPNEAPEVLNEMAMIEAIEDAPLAFVIPTEGEAAIFTDADLETQILERLEYSAFLGEGEKLNPLNEQESWLKFDSETYTFSGTPTNDDVTASGNPALPVKLVATDILVETAESVFAVSVTNTNDLFM